MANDYTSWQSEPNGRGTWSILSSCGITLVLCVYTAVHLNVPAASETRSQRWLHVTLWVFMGIFAPEAVAWTAWCQWREAKQVTQQMQDMREELSDPEKSSGKSGYNLSTLSPLLDSWTLKHSYLVIMGGFQFRPEDAVQCPHPDSKWYRTIFPYRYRPQSVLSVTGFFAFLRDGHGAQIPVLSKGDISDRSKADHLAKILSCLQAFWLLVQIIGRLASQLPITELELNTLAHVLCTIVMYVFWWNKPLRIEQPVFVDRNGVEPWLFVRSGLAQIYRKWVRDSYLDARPTHRAHVHTIDEHQLPCGQCGPCHGLYISNDTPYLGLVLCADVSASAEHVVEQLNKTSGTRICDLVVSENSSDPEQREYWDYSPSKEIHESRWLHVNQSELNFLLDLQSKNLVTGPYALADVVGYTISDSQELELLDYSQMAKLGYMDDGIPRGVTFLLSSLYGALHASLWQYRFPTLSEMWLWRISCVLVAGSGLLFASIAMGLQTDKDLTAEEKRQKWRSRVPRASLEFTKVLLPDRVLDFLDEGLHFCYYMFVFVVIFCRLFLFVEAFISLRSQPLSAYDTPNWSQWIPHL